MKPRTFSGFQGKAATLQVAGVTFMILARNSKQLELASNYILRESGQTLSPEQQVPGIIIHSSVLPQPAKRKSTHEQNDHVS